VTIKITSDKELATKIREALNKSGGFCPCALKQTPETKCMCKAFLEQEEGECHCGLYYKEKD
jgi:ferredoxin-thioredoxin reductase catalytic subunit